LAGALGPAECLVAFYNERGTREQRIKKGEGAIKWTRLSCRPFPSTTICAAAAIVTVRPQLFLARMAGSLRSEWDSCMDRSDDGP
jgi:hypothetical protein